MAYTTIDDPTIYFNTKLYTGNGSNRTITGVGFQPDWVWVKNRTVARPHRLADSVRGDAKILVSNDNIAEYTDTTQISGFDSDGFDVGTGTAVNESSQSFVSWNWLKSATAGFDIVSYTGNSSVRTISHNCGAIPKMMIVKKRSDSDNWSVYHQGTGAGNYLILNTTSASGASSTMWNNTTPTASVFSLGNKGEVNANGQTFIAYLFADIQGYSKFGSYTGNGNADGTFVYTGQKSAFIMIKAASRTGTWNMYDVKRSTFNNIDDFITANTSDAETTGNTYQNIDILSNGFKCRGTGTGTNESGSTYIYMAFAENPFVTSTGIPTTAR